MNTISPQSVVWTRALTTLAALTIAALLSSCAHFNPPEPTPEPEPAVAEKKPPPEPIKPPPPSKLYEWWGKDYVSHIEVSINEQKALFYTGDQMVGWTTVASGIHKYPTPTGSFAVTEKVQAKKSNLYGKIYNKNGKLVKRGAKMGVHKIPAGGSFKGAPMPYFMRLTNDGIGMHAGPIPRPGKRASHGCIRMPKNFAPVLYRYVDIGTPVTIKGNGPTYAKYLAKQRKSSPKPKATAVAKASPATTPTTEAASPVGTPATGQTNTAQAAADVTPTGSQTTVTPGPATSGMNGVAGNAPTQPNAVPPSNPAAETAAVMTGTPSYPSADAASAPTANTTPSPAADAAPSLPAPATLSPPAPAMTGAPPSQTTSPEPAATTSAGTAPSAAPAPTTVAAPVVPAAPPTPSPAAPASMTGVPAMQTPPAGQTAPPVVPKQPPTASGPTAQTEG